MRNVKWMSVLSLVASFEAAAMTYSDLQSAVSSAAAGSVIYVENDLTYDAPLNVTANITLKSSNGGTKTLTRAAGYAGGLFSLSGVNLTVEELVIDGAKADGNFTVRPIVVGANGKLSLKSGAVFRNFKSATVAGPIQIVDSGALEMYDGSEIR